MKNENIDKLCKRTNEKGNFFSGVLNNEDGTKTKIVVFKNEYEDKQSKPDYLIVKHKEIAKENDYNLINN